MADLITIDKYKELQGISSTKEDAKLEILVPSVSQLVKTYCGNSIVDFYSTSKVEEFSIKWETPLVQLTESPVNAVSSVETRDSVSSSYVTLDSDQYYLDHATDSIFYVIGNTYRNWPQGAGSVRVTYTAGYASCPSDLELAVVDLINYYHKDEYKPRQTLSGATRENAASGDTKGFPDHIKRVLDMYKNF